MSTSEAATLGSTSRQWQQYLLEVSIEYRGLLQERERGWHSTALDQWYSARLATPPTSENTEAPHPKPTVSKVVSSFQDADVRALCERYREHVQRLMKTSPALERIFEPTPESSASSSVTCKSFLDMGAAPGGVSKYLCEDLRWRGVGVTLADDVGGIAMDTALLARHANTVPAVAARLASGGRAALAAGAFVLLEGDVATPTTSWTVHDASAAPPLPMLTSLEVLNSMATGTADSARQAPAAARFHFVNGGAVQDHGQRQGPATTSASDASPRTGTKRSRSEGSDEVEAEADDTAILPWFTLFVPQLRHALSFVQDGGTMMIVYGVPQCASCSIWLRALETFLEPDAVPQRLADKADRAETRVHILETMHFVKSPVYLLWDGVRVSGKQEAVARLLSSAEPTSDVLCPIPLSLLRTEAQQRLATEAEAALAALPLSARPAFKRAFWRGESALGFALAKEGFDTHGPALAKLWERCSRLLAGRRGRAEAALSAASAAASASGTAAQSTSSVAVGPRPPRRGRGTFHA